MVGDKSKEIILSTAGNQTENLTVTLTSTGANCLLIDGKSTCGKTPLTLKGQATPTGRKLSTSLANNTAGNIQTTVQVCPLDKKQCGQKTFTFTATPNTIKSFKIDI